MMIVTKYCLVKVKFQQYDVLQSNAIKQGVEEMIDGIDIVLMFICLFKSIPTNIQLANSFTIKTKASKWRRAF